MNLSRCENGHFYDKEKYPSCPHCAGGSASDESLTTVFTEGDATEPLDAGGLFPPVSPIPNIPPTAEPGLPIAGFSADEPTVPLNMDNGLDTPTEVLSGMGSDLTEASDDDDHTVGFFDDDFFASPKTESVNAQPFKQPSPVVKPQVNKVSTPCVGWLVALGGAHLGTDFRLKVGKNFIGRSPQMDIALTEDKSVSRDRQAVVVYEPKEHLYLVQPGEASTLVYKNEQVVLNPVKLEAYDVITVGDVNLLFIPLCNKEFNWNTVLDELKNKAQ